LRLGVFAFSFVFAFAFATLTPFAATHLYRREGPVSISRTSFRTAAVATLFLFCLSASAQSFGIIFFKSKVALQRKLPAVVQLPGTSVKIVVTSHSNAADLAADLHSSLTSDLLKNDPRLHISDTAADSIINCEILSFDQPRPTTTTRPGAKDKNGNVQQLSYTRVTGQLRVAFQSRTRTGATLGSDNIIAKYDEEFDASGNAQSGGIAGIFNNGIKRLKGAKIEETHPPTEGELRADLFNNAVHQIVAELAVTNEVIEVFLAKGKGLDAGAKDAEAGLWTRALEAWETLKPLDKPVEDAYRLYDVGVAYEALGYASKEPQTAMKYLSQASINYGKAIDSNPAEKYFREPQKRIETALSHYEKLEEDLKQRDAK
jgi:hypothetical protein